MYNKGGIFWKPFQKVGWLLMGITTAGKLLKFCLKLGEITGSILGTEWHMVDFQ